MTGSRVSKLTTNRLNASIASQMEAPSDGELGRRGTSSCVVADEDRGGEVRGLLGETLEELTPLTIGDGGDVDAELLCEFEG